MHQAAEIIFEWSREKKVFSPFNGKDKKIVSCKKKSTFK